MYESIDMAVNLYELPEFCGLNEKMTGEGIKIKKALAPDKTAVLAFVRDTFSQGWADECEKSLLSDSCYIAVKDKSVVGFACYDSTALGYFGPLGVHPSQRGKGIATVLSHKCLTSMRERGYGYAIINAGPSEYYRKNFGAVAIAPPTDSATGVYINLIDAD